MISTIIFDLNKVLITPENINLDKEYKHYFNMTQKEVWKVGKEIFYTYQNPDKVLLESFLSQILEHFNLPNSLLSIFTDLYERAFSIIEGMEQLLNNLKKDYLLILLAGDGKESFHFKVTRFNLNRFFKYMYCSADFSMRKTKTGIYQTILKKHDLRAEETLFIDDLAIHTEIAQNIGIKTIIFKNIKQLKKDLQTFSVVC